VLITFKIICLTAHYDDDNDDNGMKEDKAGCKPVAHLGGKHGSLLGPQFRSVPVQLNYRRCPS